MATIAHDTMTTTTAVAPSGPRRADSCRARGAAAVWRGRARRAVRDRKAVGRRLPSAAAAPAVLWEALVVAAAAARAQR